MRKSLRMFIALVSFCIFVAAFALIYWKYFSDEFHYTTIEFEPSYTRIISEYETMLAKRVIATINADDAWLEKSARYFTILHSASALGKERDIEGIQSSLKVSTVGAQFSARNNNNLIFEITQEFPNEVKRSETLLGFKYFVGECNIFSTKFEGVEDSLVRVKCELSDRDSTAANDSVGLITLHFYAESISIPIRFMLNPEAGIEEDLFARMIYFSAVTATTLGYGEIVPLTMRARMVVALESVLGLILMGWLVFWVTSAPAQYQLNIEAT